MTNTKHTPGPWLSTNGYIVCNGGYTVCSVNSHGTAEGKANARLIAAAPRMAAALQHAAHLLAELNGQTPQIIALRDEIVASIKEAAPEYYGINAGGAA